LNGADQLKDSGVRKVQVLTSVPRDLLSRCVLLSSMAVACLSWSQEHEDILIDGRPLENSIAGRDWAYRSRLEVQSTNDSHELLEEDAFFRRFPATMYSAEVAAFHASSFTVRAHSEYIQSDQGFNTRRMGMSTSIPLPHVTRLRLKLSETRPEEGSSTQYLYAGVSRSLTPTVYAYSRYRHTIRERATAGQQAYQFLSWTPTRALYLTLNGAHSWTDPYRSWYARATATTLLLQESVALRLEVEHDGSTARPHSQQYQISLYRRLLQRSWASLSYRFYEDNAGFHSQTYGLKFRHFFSPRLSGHVGYRHHDHNSIPSLDTVLGGISVVF
jgi:hypothetical protein